MTVQPPFYNGVIGVLSEARRGLGAPLSHPTKEVRWAAWLGWFLVLTGLLHVGVWWLDGLPPLTGPTGWRKPIVFGLSGGVATLSLAALSSEVAARSTRWLRVYMVTMTLEIGLIDLQAWRGVGSHFNRATLFDSAVFSLMGALILASMSAAVVLGVRATRAHRGADSRLAAGLATFALAVGSLVGIAMSVHGTVVAAMGGVPSHVGAAGEWKPVHAIALHGFQLFPVFLWALKHRVRLEKQRVRALWHLGLSWGCLLSASFLQLVLGRAPLAWSWQAAGFAAAALIFAAAAGRAFLPDSVGVPRMVSQ